MGLLVDRHGFPLEIGCFEGNRAETTTILPIIEQFQKRHGIADMVVVADAGMLSAGNLKALDTAQLRFIVGSRVTKAPADLASHFRWNGDAFTDGQVIDTITPRTATKTAAAVNDPAKRAEPVWDPTVHDRSWRAVWAYSRKRAVRDAMVLTLQENKAKAVIAGEKAARTPRFVTVKNGTQTLDEASLARARRLVGLKGYVTNLPATLMPAGEVIASYHELWHVEASFRMSKTDLRARPMFHHTREAIEAHLTIVFAALAVARYLQDATGISIKKIVRTLRPLQQITVRIAGHEHLAADPLNDPARQVLDAGMLSASNLKDLDEAGLRFIVGSRVTKAPADLASHFRWHGDAFTDGQLIDTITPRVATAAARGVNDDKKRAEPVWDPGVHTRSWRTVWA